MLQDYTLSISAIYFFAWIRTDLTHFPFPILSMLIEAQINTQNYGRRPYGVGLLVGSYDEDTGPHLYECLPNANCLEYFAISIGAKGQSAKTYLEKFAKDFGDSKFSFINFCFVTKIPHFWYVTSGNPFKKTNSFGRHIWKNNH